MLTWMLRLDRALLGLLIGCTLLSLAGYAVFGLHPERLGSSVGIAQTYALAITGFPRLHILLGFLALAAILTRATSARWIGSAVALYFASLGSELLGTSVGKPFGPYRYTDALGAKWLELVPLLIPLSWLTMTLASFTLARRGLGIRRSLTTIVTGSALLIAWDLALDPAMSRLTPYWIWGEAGPYFGMPLLNLSGWFATGVVLHTILLLLRADAWVDGFSSGTLRAMMGVYAANLALPIGMTIAAGLPLAAAASLGAIGLTVLLSQRKRVAEESPVRRVAPEVVR